MRLNPENDGFNNEKTDDLLKTLQEIDSAGSDVTEEGEYSIFNDPSHYNEEAKKEKKSSRHPMLAKIIAAALCLALLGGATLAAVKLIPKISENEETAANYVLNITASDVTAVKINNKDSVLSLSSKIVEQDNSSTVFWSVEGVDESLTNSQTIAGTVAALAQTKATQTLSFEEGTDYGFDNPEISAEFTLPNGTKTVVFGDTLTSDLGVYCKVLEDNENVYVVSIDSVFEFQCVPTDFGKTDGFSGIEITSENNSCFSSDNEIISFDYVTVSGTALDSPVRVEMQQDDTIGGYFAFKLTKPSVRIGDNTTVQALIDSFKDGISATGVYSYDSSAEMLKKYGLDNPFITAQMSMAGKTYTVSFSKADEGGSCAMLVDNSPVIYKTATSSIPYYSLATTDYYSEFIILETLSSLNKFTVTAGDEVYAFDLSYSADEDGSNAVYKAFFGGTELDIKSFKDYYQTLISMTPISYESGATGKADVEIRLSHTADVGDTVLTFTQFSSQRYEVRLNGISMGLVTKTTLDSFVESTKKVSSGQ